MRIHGIGLVRRFPDFGHHGGGRHVHPVARAYVLANGQQRRQHVHDLLVNSIYFGVLHASVYGPRAALFCDLFDAKMRYTGISFAYPFSGIFASGVTPIIATAPPSLHSPYRCCAVPKGCARADEASDTDRLIVDAEKPAHFVETSRQPL